MGVRTTIALAVVALALLGYILFVERGSLTTGELDKRKADALPEFVRDRVTKIEIQRKGQRIVLERGPDPENDLDLGRWKLVEPLRAEADQDAVESLLGALEWMSVRRKIEHVGSEDRARFGFDAPRYRVWFTAGRERFPLVVGKPAPRGDGLYVQGKDPSVAQVVGKDLVEGLNHEAGDYHTKELHEGLSVLTTTALTLEDASGVRTLVKREGTWWLGEGAARAWASQPDVEAVISAIDRLRAKRFVAAEAKDPHAYGFDAPFADLVATYSKFVAPHAPESPGAPPPPKPRTEDVNLRLVVGAACAGHAGERYARADAGAVMCIAEADLAEARKSVDELRERRLLPFDAMTVKTLRLERDGHALALTRKDEKWSYELRGDKAVLASGQVRDGAAAAWMESLAAARAESFAPTSDAAVAGGRWRLHVEREGESTAYDVAVLDAGASGVRVRRGDEPWHAAYASAVAERLTPESALDAMQAPAPVAAPTPTPVAPRGDAGPSPIE